MPYLTDLRTIIIRNQKSAFDVKKSVTQSDMIFCSKPYVLVVILCSKIRRIAVEKADGSIVLLNQLFKILVFNNYFLLSSCGKVDHREVRPHRMRLTSKAVKTACIAVTYKLIKLSRPVNVIKSWQNATLMK